MGKKCCKCHKYKLLNEFGVVKNNKDGKSYRCKICTREKDRYKYATDVKRRNYIRKYVKKWFMNPENKKMHSIKGAISSKKSMKKYRLKHNARSRVKSKIKTGKILKPNKCSKCNKIFPIRKIEGHHPDYTKPLNVVWVCRSCHKLIERKYD